MSYIFYLPDEKKVEAAAKQTVLQASLKAKIPHAHACRGRGRCSTCRVIVLEGLEYCSPPGERERKLAKKLHFDPAMRLACQVKVTGDVVVKRPVLDAIDMKLTNQLTRKGHDDHAGEEKKLAILFCDIEGYTSFAESLPPYDVVHVLNRYYMLMGEVIAKNKGIISDYIGDGLLALFGVQDVENPSLHALRAGLAMFQALKELNPYLMSMFHKCFKIRIGVHYGTVVVGTFGNLQFKKVSAIGDAVNLASRIEEANKETGTHFLISEETYHEVKTKVAVDGCFPMNLRGKKGDYKLYEVVGMK